MLQIGRGSLPRSEQLASYWLGNAKSVYEPVNLEKILQRLEKTVVEEKKVRSTGLRRLRGLRRNGRIPFIQGKQELQISAPIWWAAFAWNVIFAEDEKAPVAQKAAPQAAKASAMAEQIKPTFGRTLVRQYVSA